MKRWSLDARSQAPLDWSHRVEMRGNECAQWKNNSWAAYLVKRSPYLVRKNPVESLLAHHASRMSRYED
jgi:hypothetical protein